MKRSESHLESGDTVSEPHFKPWITQVLIPAGSLLIAALALLSNYQALPAWISFVAAFYLVVVTGSVLHGRVCNLIRVAKRQIRIHRSADTYYPQVLSAIEGLRHLIEPQRSDTLICVLDQAVQWEELRNLPRVNDSKHVETLRSWLLSIGQRGAMGRRADFATVTAELGLLIHRYNRYCAQKLRVLQEAVVTANLVEPRSRQLRQQWNLNRETHTEYVRQWSTLLRVINRACGAQLCSDYYESVRTLE